MPAVVPFLRRRAMLKGPLGGSRQWTAVWMVLVAARLLKRFTRGKEEVLFKGEIRPGEALLVSGGRADER